MRGFNPDRGFGVYVHWPYCARICPYCDFNVYAAKARDTAPLFGAIMADLAGWRERTGARQAGDAARFADFAAAGVNRLSLGLQSLDDERLKFLGRTHSSDDALKAFALAGAAFGSVSLDLIYAQPGQDAPAWRAELARVLELGADHLSLYELTIEPGAAFAFAVTLLLVAGADTTATLDGLKKALLQIPASAAAFM